MDARAEERGRGDAGRRPTGLTPLEEGRVPGIGARRRSLESVSTYAKALLAGAVLAAGTPPFDLYPAFWLGMAALAWLLDDDAAPPALVSPLHRAFPGVGRGMFFGVGANLVILRFIPAVLARFTPLPWAGGVLALWLLAAFEGLRWMTAGVACQALARARMPFPLAFAAGVYAGTFVPTVMPWTPAGGVSPWPAMVQLADVAGERGVAAVMALCAGLIARGVRSFLRPETRRCGASMVGAALLITLAELGGGAARMAVVDRATHSSPHARVALLQPSIEATLRWNDASAPAILATLTSLTRRAEARGADLVVWPETAYPYPLRHGSRREPDTLPSILQPTVHGPVLTGVMMKGAESGDAYNAAVVATPDGALSDSYDKRHLLWFGETVPLADRLPGLRRVFARGLGLVAGDRAVALTAGRVRAAVLICYEDMLPEAGREAMEVSPNLLVNVSNDAWFSGSAESDMHLRVAALRAVEQRRDLVRAVNFGPASWVDAAGRVRMRSSQEAPAVLLAEPALFDSWQTLYARFGDAPLTLLFLVLAAAYWTRSFSAFSAVARTFF
jgi:apolipoprotein N-acyltransferase